MAFSHVWRTLVRQPVNQPTSAFGTLCQQTRDVIARLGLRRRGCRAGKHHRCRVEAARRMTSLTAGDSARPGAIPVIVGNRCSTGVQPMRNRDDRVSALSLVRRGCAQHNASTVVGLLNARSVGSHCKHLAIYDRIVADRLHLCPVVETWHDAEDSPPCYRYIDKARPRAETTSLTTSTNHGGLCLFFA